MEHAAAQARHANAQRWDTKIKKRIAQEKEEQRKHYAQMAKEAEEDFKREMEEQRKLTE